MVTDIMKKVIKPTRTLTKPWDIPFTSNCFPPTKYSTVFFLPMALKKKYLVYTPITFTIIDLNTISTKDSIYNIICVFFKKNRALNHF